MLKLQLHTNVNTPLLYRTGFHVNQEKLDGLIEKVEAGKAIGIRDCYGVLLIKRSGVHAVEKAKKQIYYTITIPNYEDCLTLLRGYVKHSPEGWEFTTTTLSMHCGKLPPTVYNVYYREDGYVITPSDVILGVCGVNMNQFNNSFDPRFVEQKAIRGERFIHELVSEVVGNVRKGRTPEFVLDFSSCGVTGPGCRYEELDELGLYRTPLAFEDRDPIGHGDLKTLLSEYFDVTVDNRWIDIRTHADNLKWHGSAASPYSARDYEHYYEVINQLKPLAIAAAQGAK